MTDDVAPTNSNNSSPSFDELKTSLLKKYDLEDRYFVAKRKYRILMDSVTPYRQQRWLAFFLLFLVFVGRIYSTEAFAFVCYCVLIVYLKNLMLYLQPCDSYLAELEIAVENDFVLPTRENDEFKPFERKKPEMEVWKSLMRTTLTGILCTFFSILDFDFNAFVLVGYFLFVAVVLFRAKMKHMQYFKYSPFDLGKKVQYAGEAS
uniref:Protein RER1 n=1 Tax=Strombidium inclinatum TaxID=197538 RepID=A0A7S3MZX4_9SPIT